MDWLKTPSSNVNTNTDKDIDMYTHDFGQILQNSHEEEAQQARRW